MSGLGGQFDESTVATYMLVIHDVNKEGNPLIVRLDYEGAVEYGEGYAPVDGADAFWRALGGEDVLRKAAEARGYKLVKEDVG